MKKSANAQAAPIVVPPAKRTRVQHSSETQSVAAESDRIVVSDDDGALGENDSNDIEQEVDPEADLGSFFYTSYYPSSLFTSTRSYVTENLALPHLQLF